MAKGDDEIKIQDAIHKYRMLENEFKQGSVSRRELVEAAYNVSDAYSDASINHTSWRDEKSAREWFLKGKFHSIQLAHETVSGYSAIRKLEYLEDRRMERFDVLKYIGIFCGVTAVGLILFMAYGILTFHK